jgi:hypothetical protein
VFFGAQGSFNDVFLAGKDPTFSLTTIRATVENAKESHYH